MTPNSKVTNPEKTIIKITVWDEDTVSSDDLMGKIDIPLPEPSSEKQEYVEQWYPVVPAQPKEEVSGEINLKLKMEKNGDKKMLHVTGMIANFYFSLMESVVQGRNLASRDSNGLSVTSCGDSVLLT
jgi:hypothetical protein